MLDTVAYHGTDAARFSRFDLRRAGSATDEGLLGRGVYLSTDPAVARNRRFCVTARVRLEHPLALSATSWATNKSRLASDALGLAEVRSGASLTRAAKAAGYDGVVLDYSKLGYHQQEIVTFDPDAIDLLDHNDSCADMLAGRVTEQRVGGGLNAPRRVSLYRAADEPTAWSGSHFTDHEDDARAYLDNPGFGGARLFRYDVVVDGDRVADTSGRDGRLKLAEFAGYENAEDQAERWRDASLDWIFHVLDNRPDVERRLRNLGFEWVIYDDDYPEGAVTWRYIGPEGAAPEASEELNTQ